MKPARSDPQAERAFEAAVSAQRAGRLQEAIAGYQLVLKRAPLHAGALTNLGTVFKNTGRTQEALTSYRKALAIEPGLAAASVNLARLLVAVATRHFNNGDAAAAEAAFGEAARLQPGSAPAHIGHGMALKDLGQRDAAIECWKRAVTIDPRNAAAHNNLGALYRLLKRPQDAVHHLRTAISLMPDDSMAQANLAHALLEQGATTEATRLARDVVERDPQSSDGHMMLGFALAYQGEIEAAVKSFLQSHHLQPGAAMPISNALFASLYSDQCSADDLLALHRDLSARIVPAKLTPVTERRPPSPRPKIGYLSPDLRQHPVSVFFEPILAYHDMREFEIHCYSTSFIEDEVTARLRATGAVWHTCADWTDERIAAQIGSDGIDILVDLAGHTAQNRASVLRAKPAPVQALYIGYPGTSGIPEMDYCIADARVCPPGHERFYSERVIRLDGSYWCFQPPADAPLPAEAPLGRNGFVTFGSFNALQKITPATMALWLEILRIAPTSRLVLKSLPFADEALRETVRRRFTDAGVAWGRVDILSPSVSKDFLGEYSRIDIALDTFPYNGGTTTFEALWMGVPVLTLAGERFCSRMAASALINIGMDEMVTDSPSQYVQLAAALAVDPGRVVRLRSGLRERLAASACCDGSRAARELEAAFREMIALKRSGQDHRAD